MNKPYHFYDGLYFQNYFFCPGFTPKEFQRAVIKNVGNDPGVLDFSGVRARMLVVENWNDGRAGIFIWTKFTKINADMINSLSHEAYHCVMEIFEKRGIKPDTKNDEPGAYLMGWIMYNLMKSLETEGLS